MMDINQLIKQAMHEKDMTRLNVLKLIKAEFLKKSKEPGRTVQELSDDEQLKALMKMVAQRKDSIQQYEKANRMDLAESEKNELEILNSFLPKEASEEEVRNYTLVAIDQFISSQPDGYMLSMKDMKDVMAIVKEKYPTANGNIVSAVLKEKC